MEMDSLSSISMVSPPVLKWRQKRPQKPPRRDQNHAPVKNLHIIYAGHFRLVPPADWQYNFLFYCKEHGEQNGTPHTHMGVRLTTGIPKTRIISGLQRSLEEMLEIQEQEMNMNMNMEMQLEEESKNEEEEEKEMSLPLPDVVKYSEIEVVPHPRFETVLGYHLGFSENKKISCDHEKHLSIILPPNFDTKQYVKDKLAHRRTTSVGLCLQQNQMLLENSVNDLVKQGLLHLKQLTSINLAKQQFQLMETQEGYSKRPDMPVFIPNSFGKLLPFDLAHKKRHFWIYGPPNTGKTTFARELVRNYRAVMAEHDQGTFENVYDNTQVFLMDRVRGGGPNGNKPDIALLEGLCDGTKKLKIKYQAAKEVGTVVVIVLSNFSIAQVYPEDCSCQDGVGVLGARFNEILLVSQVQAQVQAAQFANGISKAHIGNANRNQNQNQNQNQFQSLLPKNNHLSPSSLPLFTDPAMFFNNLAATLNNDSAKKEKGDDQNNSFAFD